MATRTSDKKTTAKKGATSSKATKARKRNVKITSTAVVVSLDGTLKRRAQQCLRDTGKITLGFEEVSSTRLNDLADAIVTVN